MTKYGTKLTAVGIAKLANAQVTSNKVQITHIAIGDGNGVAYTPIGNETALKREKWRGIVNKAELGTGNTIVVEGIVPATVGGFTMREVGLYDADGDMIAVGNYPETERAGTVDGVANELILRTLIKVNNASAVDLTINTDLVIATKAEMNVVTQQLAQTDGKLKNIDATVVNVKDFGAKGDYNLNDGTGTDDTIAIQNAINATESRASVTIIFPPGRYKITKKLNITRFNVEFKGSGMQTTDICYTGPLYDSVSNPDGECILNIYNGGAGSARILIKDISFHGGDKTLWAIKADGSSGLTLENVRTRRTWGHLQILNSPLLNTKNCIFEWNTATRPTGARHADWLLVKNKGLIHLYECHGYTFDKYFVYGPGHIEDEGPLRSVFFIESTVVGTHNKGVIERDARYLGGAQVDDVPAISHVFLLTSMIRNFKINDLYYEHIDALCMLSSNDKSNTNMSVDGVYMNMCSFYYYPIYIIDGSGVQVSNIYAWGVYFNERHFAYTNSTVLENPMLTEIYWHNGKKGGIHNRKTIDGNVYADSESPGVGMMSTNAPIVTDGKKVIRVNSGLTVTVGIDSIGKYVAVTGGNITNHLGKRINVGIALSTGLVGWIIRPVYTPGTLYNVCVDGYGFVWVEPASTAPTDNGKAVIAQFNVDSLGDVFGLVAVRNIHRGTFMFGGRNKTIYSSEAPTAGLYAKGDRMVNMTGDAGGNAEMVCVTAGMPGVWKNAGTIDS